MRHIVTVFFLFCTALFMGRADATSASNSLSVASTIKPVQALVYAIAHPMLTTTQLIPDNASPHHYQVRPSTLRQLQQAALIFRVDADLETPFTGIFKQLSASQQLITLSHSTGLKRLALRQSNENQTATAAKEEETEEEYDHEHHSGEDLHLWLNPENGIIMAKIIEQTLSQRFPQFAAQFERNTQQLINNIQQTDQHIRQQLAPIQQKAFVTFHDAWQYFDSYYQLRFAGSISNNQLQQTSAKHLQTLREKIQQQQVTCLFHEPQFPQHAAKTLAEDLTLNTAVLDPLGNHLALSANTYPELLQSIADSLSTCLQSKSTQN